MIGVSFKVSEEYRPSVGECVYRLGPTRYVASLATVTQLLEDDKIPVNEAILATGDGDILLTVVDGKVSKSKIMEVKS